MTHPKLKGSPPFSRRNRNQTVEALERRLGKALLAAHRDDSNEFARGEVSAYIIALKLLTGRDEAAVAASALDRLTDIALKGIDVSYSRQDFPGESEIRAISEEH